MSAPDEVISRDLSSRQLEADGRETVDAYWTAERMAEAAPLEFDDDTAERDFSLFAEDFALPTDAEATVDFETARVADRSIFPFSAFGKLFMTFNGRPRFGTAWVVGDRAIVTAGHCLYDELAEDAWADQVLFVPQYHRGHEPVGRWTATSVHTLAGWAARGADMRRYDMGGAILDRPVEPATGSIEWRAHQPHSANYLSVGYPKVPVSNEHPFDGEEMWRCTGRFISGQNPLKMANNMTRGSSGGAWLVSAGGRVHAAGLNSFRAADEPLTVQSPSFSANFVNLLSTLARRRDSR